MAAQESKELMNERTHKPPLSEAVVSFYDNPRFKRLSVCPKFWIGVGVRQKQGLQYTEANFNEI